MMILPNISIDISTDHFTFDILKIYHIICGISITKVGFKGVHIALFMARYQHISEKTLSEFMFVKKYKKCCIQGVEFGIL